MIKLPSPMPTQQHFAQVPAADITRSRFDRSHAIKLTFDSGYLIPFFCDEILPSDTHQLSMHVFARLATPKKAPMDNLRISSFFFFVPNRLTWNKWQQFCGEDADGTTPNTLTVPVLDTTGYALPEDSTFDMLGLPTQVSDIAGIIALPFRSILLIWNEWFRDQNLQSKIGVLVNDGPDTASIYASLFRRGKRPDYFWACLPFPQKGPAVAIPLGGGNLPIVWDSVLPGAQVTNFWMDEGGGMTDFGLILGESRSAAKQGVLPGTGGQLSSTDDGTTNATNQTVEFRGPAPTMPSGHISLSAGTMAAINVIRLGFQTQKALERDARGGTRYIEMLKAHYGAINPDFRLQRPEYLGGGTTNIFTTPVAQTSATETGTPQGNITGYTTASVRGHGFTHSFTEHGYVIGFLHVTADQTIQQGLHRFWTRSGRFSYYYPVFSSIGEQAVLSKEIYCDASANDEDVWGYQEAWAEYRYMPSRVGGAFRSNYPGGGLDIWHYALDFETRPTLIASIEDMPPVDRTVVSTSEPEVLADIYMDLKSTRPMPTYSVPGLIDHF